MKSIVEAFPQFEQKTAIVRTGFDVPIENGQVQDTSRIEDAVATIKLLRDHHCKVVLLSHVGRPEGQFSQPDSLRPVAAVLSSLLAEPVEVADYQPDYRQISLPNSDIVLVENLRFWPEEETNDPQFGEYLSTLGDIFVNEAFSVCHRKHASIVGIAPHKPSFAGIALAKEMNALSRVRINPERPLVVVIGGAKLDTKLPLVNAFAPVADRILVGGKVAAEMNNQVVPANVTVAELVPDGRDISESSARDFATAIMGAKTVVWNGAMGVFEEPDHQLGTKIVAEAINQTPAYTMMGGGDTETALTLFNLEGGIDHISSGGGAMLTFLVEGKLAGVEALDDH